MRRLRSKGKSGKQSKRLSNPTCVFLLEFNKSVIKLESNRLVSVTGEKMKTITDVSEMKPYCTETGVENTYYNPVTKNWFEVDECSYCGKTVFAPNSVTANKPPPNAIITIVEPDEELVYSNELFGAVCEVCEAEGEEIAIREMEEA
jgi:hypothetical protein